jgi:hypothetical protein
MSCNLFSNVKKKEELPNLPKPIVFVPFWEADEESCVEADPRDIWKSNRPFLEHSTENNLK